jgi:Glycosyltransferase (GlcNAc)
VMQVVLSHYPASSEDPGDKEVPRICNSTYLEDVGVWRLWEAENQLPPGQYVPVSSRLATFSIVEAELVLPCTGSVSSVRVCLSRSACLLILLLSCNVVTIVLQTPFAAAGFMFYAGHMLLEVPFDPHLPYLFDGEEILYSARLWTHG